MKKLVYQNNVEYALYIGYSKFGCLIEFNEKSVDISTVEPIVQLKALADKFKEVIPNSKAFKMNGFGDSSIVRLVIEDPNYFFKLEDDRLYVVTGNYGWELCS